VQDNNKYRQFFSSTYAYVKRQKKNCALLTRSSIEDAGVQVCRIIDKDLSHLFVVYSQRSYFIDFIGQ